MPSETSSFFFIEQYKNMARELGEQSCTDMVTMDQEVPQTRSYLEEGDIKTEVKMESQDSQQSPDISTYMEQIFASTENTLVNTSSLNMSLTTPQYAQLTVSPASSGSSNSYSDLISSSSISSSSHLHPVSSSPLLSSVAAPSIATSQSLSSPAANFLNNFKSEPKVVPEVNGLKARTFVSELGGSGCTVVTSSSPDSSFTTDFLTGDVYSSSTSTFPSDNITPPSMCVPEGSLDYLDLDKQPLSLYDDMKPTPEQVKLENFTASSGESSAPLEEAAIFMRDVIHHDCDNLNVPYDPMLWNVDNVRTWVSWVCQKNGVPDISTQIQPMNGRMLCSLQFNDFRARYGRVGDSLSTELELWKAANSCFPELSLGNQSVSFMPQQQQHQLANFADNHSPAFGQVGPCVSPAPSTGSSSQDSHLASSGSLSEHSDDEGNFLISSTSNLQIKDTKPNGLIGGSKLGRGHKQTIHLWQFLRELLLSKENHSDCIRWLDRNSGIFKIEDSKKVASLWGARKNRPAMNYDKLSRSVRQYYKKGIIKKTQQSKRLVYQFCAGYL